MDHDANLGAQESIGNSCSSLQAEAGAFFGDGEPEKNPFLQIEPVANSEFSDSYIAGQEDERLRMGRELHDSTGQLLLALRLSVAHLRGIREGEDAEQILIEIDETARQIDEEIRTFSFMNYPVELGKNDLVVALGHLAKGFGQRTGLKVRFQSCCEQAQADPSVSAALLRIAQEAMTNVHRHARASSVQLSLVEHRGHVELVIKDDGCGLAAAGPETVDGVGLQGMRHRIERLGGAFKVTRLRQGTRVAVSLPDARFYAAKAA